MLPGEAHWLGEVLAGIPAEALSPLVNLGSGSLSFRDKAQPFLAEVLFGPLENRGVKVVHVDRDDADGVDVVGDIGDPDLVSEIRGLRPGAVLCANVLEHVVDRRRTAEALLEMTPGGGLLAVTVPLSYPYHPSPI